jgi:hypothetical protein
MMPFSRLITVALLAACAAAMLGAGARAEPLDPDACKALKAERQSLLTGEVKAALARGPDWVKDHLHSAEEIENVREYLQVEAKVAFRCRTDGVVMPKPKPVPLPDRKPPVPKLQVAEGTPSQVLAGAAANSLLPLRKPSLSTQAADASGEDAPEQDSPEQDSANAEAGQESGDAEPDEESVEDLAEAAPESDPGSDPKEITTSLEPDPGPSQTVADSDKTAPPKTKATQ